MNLAAWLHHGRRLTGAVALLLAVAGAFAWFTMDRQEDPYFPDRYGQVTVQWPGADPRQIERLVLDPLEEELAQVEEVDELRGTARTGLAFVIVGMRDDVYATDRVWERVRVAAARAERRFPRGAGRVTVDDRAMASQGVVLALGGSPDLLALAEAAKELRRRLLALSEVARVRLYGDPGEQVTVALDDAVARRAGLAPEALARQIEAANRVLPAGSLALEGRTTVLRPETEVLSLDELRRVPVRLGDGSVVPLQTVASVFREPAVPASERYWLDGEPVVGVGLALVEDRINVVRFGKRLRSLLNELRGEFAPLEIHEVHFQPDWVEARLSELGRTLLIAIGILAAVLFLVMGLRLGLTVAAIVPLVTFASLAVYAMGGGVLHQIAIAGMVIALGMLVDNAIVMVENVQWHLERGMARAEAAAMAVRELAAPLAAATGTTLAAFLPLLVARGDAPDFTRGIPVMVMLTLAMSWLVAMLVTPLLAQAWLRPAPAGASAWLAERGATLGRLAVEHPWRILAVALVLIAGALSLTRWVDREFFPNTDRNQVIVDLHFPHGTHIDYTAARANTLAHDLRALDKVTVTRTAVGFTGPGFYYNLMETPQVPHRARIVVDTVDVADTEAVIGWVREYGRRHLPDAWVVARRLGQGPPLEAPVELRVMAEDREKLRAATETVTTMLRETPGAVDVRHGLGFGLATLRYRLDDAALARYGLDRAAVGRALGGRVFGLEASVMREGREPIPVRVRSLAGERQVPDDLAGSGLAGEDGTLVPLAQVARGELTWEPAVIEHRDLRRVALVLAGVADGHTYSSILDGLEPRLAQAAWPEGVDFALGGDAEGARDAYATLFRALPAGALLLLVFLLLKFNSFRRLGIILATVPLAAVGVVPGLLLAGQSFGFTAMLGVVALVGIVVNNAIVLIDVMDDYTRGGMERASAITAAVQRRIRPILLTTATTVAGMVPLTFTQSTLWPPLAWAVISGLIASSALTLLVVPALCHLLLNRDTPRAARAG